MPSGMRAPAREVTTAAAVAGRDELKDEGGGCLVQPVSVVDDQNQVPVAGAVQNGPPHGLQQIKRPGGVIRAAVGGCSGARTAADRVHQGPEGGEGDARTVAAAMSHWASTSSGAPALISTRTARASAVFPTPGGSHQQDAAAVVETREGAGALRVTADQVPRPVYPLPHLISIADGGRWPLVVADVTQGVTDPAW